MNQPPNPAPPRSERPQLFKAPAHARQHADFGPSILATIDGGQSRFTEPRGRMPAKRLLLVGAFAALGATAYVAIKVHATHAPLVAPAADSLLVKLQQPVVVAIPAALAASASASVSAAAPAPAASVGAASIETVAPALAVAPVAASAATAVANASTNAAPNVAGSLNNIQLALDRSPAASVPVKKPVSKEVHPVHSAPVAAVSPQLRGKSAADSDEELLAAMLPHLPHKPSASTNSGFEKRCGQLTGYAALDCRAKFCKGREGAEAACPVAQPAHR